MGIEFNEKIVKLEFGKSYAWGLFTYGIAIVIL